MSNPLTFLSRFWKDFRWKTPVLGLLLILILVFVVLIASQDPAVEPEVQEDVRSRVTVRSLSDIGSEQIIEETSVLEPVDVAPLIARTGGRVTDVKQFVGSQVKAGQLVAEIDGGVEASPARAQVAGLSQGLAAFNAVEAQAIRSAQTAIEIAKASLEAAQTGEDISVDQRQAVLQSAELGVEQAQQQVLQTSDTRAQGIPTEDIQTIITTAQLGVEAAQLAQEQAQLAQRLATTQTETGLEQAQLGLQSAQIGRERIVAEMASQRSQLKTQLAVASAQVQQMQVTAPTTGTIASLTIREGDYIQPGQQVGEVLTVGNAFMRVFVTTYVRNTLTIGQSIPVTVGQTAYTGRVARLADAPNSRNSMWQVDLVVENQVRTGDLYESATAQFIGDAGNINTLLLPIDSVNIREQGVVAFVVTGDDVIEEYVLNVIDYHGNYIEVERTLPNDALLVVEGNRRVQAGDVVEVVR